MGKPHPEGKSGWPGESEGRAGESPGRGNLRWLRRGLSSRQAGHLPWVFQIPPKLFRAKLASSRSQISLP